MADTFTPNLNLDQPEIGASDDTWGDKINADLATLDALFATTGTGTVIVRDSNNDALVSGVNLNKAAGNARLLKIKSGTSTRWDIGADATAEGGANAGSLFKLNRYDDSGSFLGTPIIVDRASGLVTFETTPQVGSNGIWHAGNDGVLRTPVGLVVPFLGTAAPNSNWLLLYGQTFVTASYPDLATLIGTTFNTGGEGTGNTRLPDLRDVVIAGLGDMGGVDRGLFTVLNALARGTVVGAESHTLTHGELPSVNFTVTDPGHSHPLPAGAMEAGVPGAGTFEGGSTNFTTFNTTNSATTGITVSSGGSGTPFRTVQPTTFLSFMVRALP